MCDLPSPIKGIDGPNNFDDFTGKCLCVDNHTDIYRYFHLYTDMSTDIYRYPFAKNKQLSAHICDKYIDMTTMGNTRPPSAVQAAAPKRVFGGSSMGGGGGGRGIAGASFNIAEARRVLAQGNPRGAMWYLGRVGKAYVSHGNLDAANVRLDEAIRILDENPSPDHRLPQLQLARVLAHSHRGTEADGIISAIAADAPHRPASDRIFTASALTLMHIGHRDRALQTAGKIDDPLIRQTVTREIEGLGALERLTNGLGTAHSKGDAAWGLFMLDAYWREQGSDVDITSVKSAAMTFLSADRDPLRTVVYDHRSFGFMEPDIPLTADPFEPKWSSMRGVSQLVGAIIFHEVSLADIDMRACASTNALYAAQEAMSIFRGEGELDLDLCDHTLRQSISALKSYTASLLKEIEEHR